jgi:hypothetical protein
VPYLGSFSDLVRHTCWRKEFLGIFGISLEGRFTTRVCMLFHGHM